MRKNPHLYRPPDVLPLKYVLIVQVLAQRLMSISLLGREGTTTHVFLVILTPRPTTPSDTPSGTRTGQPVP